MNRKYLSLAAVILFLLPMACSNWNRATPSNIDNAAIEAEVRKNLTADGIDGISISVDNGVVTLNGAVETAKHDVALNDARKVPGVNRVVDNLQNR